MTLKKGYCFCRNQWFLDNEIKNELRMLLAISCLTAKTGACLAGNKYFADIFNIGENKVSEKIKKLEAKGYIKIEYERQGCQIKKRKIKLIYDSQKQESTIPEKGKENNINIIIKENILKEKHPQSNPSFDRRAITEDAEQKRSIGRTEVKNCKDSCSSQELSLFNNTNTPLENNNTINARQGISLENNNSQESYDMSENKDLSRRAVDNWNYIAEEFKLPTIKVLTSSRISKLKARIKQVGGWKEFWQQVYDAISQSKFLKTGNETWKCNFDFVLQESSFVKMIEHQYK